MKTTLIVRNTEKNGICWLNIIWSWKNWKQRNIQTGNQKVALMDLLVQEIQIRSIEN